MITQIVTKDETCVLDFNPEYGDNGQLQQVIVTVSLNSSPAGSPLFESVLDVSDVYPVEDKKQVSFRLKTRESLYVQCDMSCAVMSSKGEKVAGVIGNLYYGKVFSALDGHLGGTIASFPITSPVTPL